MINILLMSDTGISPQMLACLPRSPAITCASVSKARQLPENRWPVSTRICFGICKVLRYWIWRCRY